MDFILLGNRIRESRKKEKLTQSHLAERAGVSVNHIGYIENARTHVSLELLHKIAIALCTSIGRLTSPSCDGGVGHLRETLYCELADCSEIEMTIIFDSAINLKESIRRNLG